MSDTVVREAVAEAELAAVQQLRYEVYTAEMGLYRDAADASARRLRDAHDEGALQLLRSRNVTSLQGDDLSIRLRRFSLYVNDSRVINPNVKAPNGIIHTIDKVLLP